MSQLKHVVSAVAFAMSVAAFGAAMPNEVIVKYKKNATRDRQFMTDLYSAVGVAKVKRFSARQQGMEQLLLKDNVKLEDALFELRKNPAVAYAQPNFILRLPKAVDPLAKRKQDGVPCIPGMDIPGCDPNKCIFPGIPFPPGCTDSGGGGGGGTPGARPDLKDAPADTIPPVADADLSKAYGIAKIGATEAWATHRGDKKFVVAVIDTGLDYNHPDLAFNVWRNPNPSDKKDIVGYDFIHNDGLPFDDQSHGTHTSGTIGAVGGNGIGVSGVNQRVSIMGVKFLSAQGSGTTADAVRGIDYAIEHGAKVLSNSWGGSGDEDNKALYDAIERAKAKDVLFVAAAGNDGVDNDTSPKKSYPASFDNDNLISVAATDANDQLASFSNRGVKSTHLGAPGVKVYSLAPGGSYATHDGTSMACPHVAGAAALVWSKNPTWTYKQVKSALMASVDKVPSLQGKTVTGGRLNVLKALTSTNFRR